VTARAFWVAAILAIAAIGVAQQKPSIRAEAAWADATAITLVQQSPHPRSATPYTTTLRVIADHNTLYFGFTCADSKRKKIAVDARRDDPLVRTFLQRPAHASPELHHLDRTFRAASARIGHRERLRSSAVW